MMECFDSMNLIWMLPEITLALGALLLVVVGSYAGKHATRFVWVLTHVVLLAAGYGLYLTTPEEPILLFDGLYIIDGFSQFVKALLLIASYLVLVLVANWLKERETPFFEKPILMVLAITGMMVMTSSNDLLSLYMGLELSSLALYVLAASDRDNAVSSEAGLKYFVLGALASGLMLFGASLVYGYTGSTNFTDIEMLFSVSGEGQGGVAYGAVLGMVFLAVALCFKISAAPFHMWTPDVYTGAPSAVTLFFATAPKVAAMAVFVRLLAQPFESMFPDWQNILALAANASMIIGALGAMMQTNLKRLLAYGSIGHIGYALVGVASGTGIWPKAVLLYLAIYLVMSLIAFGFILFIRRDGKPVEQISDLAGFAKAHPLIGLMMLIVMFSMAGIPPLAGFYAKMFVFLSAIEADMYVMTVIGLLTSVIAAYYYLRVVKVMYFDEVTAPIECRIPLLSRGVFVLGSVAIAGFFLAPSWLLNTAEQAAQTLF